MRIEKDDERVEEDEIDSYLRGTDAEEVYFKLVCCGEAKKGIYHVATGDRQNCEEPPFEILLGLGNHGIGNDQAALENVV